MCAKPNSGYSKIQDKIRKIPHQEMVLDHLHDHLKDLVSKERGGDEKIGALRKKLHVSWAAIYAVIPNLAKFYKCHVALRNWHPAYGEKAVLRALRALSAFGLLTKENRPIPNSSVYSLRPACSVCEKLFYPSQRITKENRQEFEARELGIPTEADAYKSLLGELDKRRNTDSLKKTSQVNMASGTV